MIAQNFGRTRRGGLIVVVYGAGLAPGLPQAAPKLPQLAADLAQAGLPLAAPVARRVLQLEPGEALVLREGPPPVDVGAPFATVDAALALYGLPGGGVGGLLTTASQTFSLVLLPAPGAQLAHDAAPLDQACLDQAAVDVEALDQAGLDQAAPPSAALAVAHVVATAKRKGKAKL